MDQYKKMYKGSSPSDSDRSRRMMENHSSQLSSKYTEGISTSAYTVRTQNTSFQTPLPTDVTSDPPSSSHSRRVSVQSLRQGNQATNESIRLIPVKVKDIMELFKTDPAYRDKSPVMINMKENDIDQIISQKFGNGMKLSASPQQSYRLSLHESPMSVRRSLEKGPRLRRRSLDQEPSPNQSMRQSFNKPIPQSLRESSDRRQTKPPLGADQAPQVYAMTDIQAYPMVGTSGFRVNKTRRKKTPRAKSRRRITPARRVSMKPRRKKRSRSRKHSRSRKRSRSKKRPRPRSRGRSRWPRSRPKRIVCSRRKTPVVIINKQRRCIPQPPALSCCTPYPVCDNECTTRIRTPECFPNRPSFGEPRVSVTCTCNLCTEKLQFIQPGMCSKKKYTWTNEYAILPKHQVNLIDPCEELDRTIYPRADNPCIRDSRGNPLTDCIGRPLRDPVGKNFLTFNPNGSVMDTNFRGNFYTGQPPVCVKCTFPSNTCGPDTTHNWWQSCGYPIRANMNDYFQRVVAMENQERRC